MNGSGLGYLTSLRSDITWKVSLGLEDSLPRWLIHVAGKLDLLLARGLSYSPWISVDRKSYTLTSIVHHTGASLLYYGNRLQKDVNTRKPGSLGAVFEASYPSLPCGPRRYPPPIQDTFFPSLPSKAHLSMPQAQAVGQRLPI